MHNLFILKGKDHHHMKEDFIGGICIIFSVFFYLVMFHESQTWGPMAVEKM
jgi:hypothetical protein